MWLCSGCVFIKGVWVCKGECFCLIRILLELVIEFLCGVVFLIDKKG